MTNKVCATCAYYRPTDDDLGECRHHAPRGGGFPVIHSHTWCGDWISGDLEYDSKRDYGTVVVTCPHFLYQGL